MFLLKSSLILVVGFSACIFIFLNGILMSRSEVHEINDCPVNAEYCKFSPYKKMIFLLVDALKFEFLDLKLNQTNYYHGNMDIVKSLKKSSKEKYSYLNHFISDPPTTTLQRIKGLTTGSLPTFIDISTNFGSSELLEDNIIQQWQNFGFDLKFVGDDTWTNLFPRRFNKSLPYPSFNVKDLDTVDRGVEKFIIENLSNKTRVMNQRPQILLGHMLGVDHCGHTYGKNHPQMKRKLMELNEFLKKIISLMDKDTLVVVFGDHGMTSSGDHGGESVEEVDAAIFVVSEKPLNYHRQSAMEQNQVEYLSQIDIVPTIAAITGVAIPFSNLGVLRPEMLTSIARAEQYLKLNIKQMSQYIAVYEKTIGNLNLPEDIRHYLTLPDDKHTTNQSLAILKTIQGHFRSKWAQFNVILIYGGIIGCILHLLALISHLFTDQSKMRWRYCLYLSLISSLLIIDSSIIVSLLTFLTLLELVYISKLLWSLIPSLCNNLHCISVLISCAYFLVPMSNSFIVSEDIIVQYFLQTLLLGKTLQCLVQYFTNVLPPKHKKSQTKSAFRMSSLLSILTLFLFGTVFLVFGMSYKICREEQRAWCETDYVVGSSVQFVIFLLPLLCVAHRLWLDNCGNLDSSESNVMIVKFVLPIAGICLFFHHCMQLVDESSKYLDVAKATSLIFPRMAVLSSLLSLGFFVVKPLLMRHRKRFDNVKRIDVPSLFKYLREQQSNIRENVIVHGLATIYSSAIFTVLLASTIFVVVFLKVQFVVGIVSVIGFLFVYSVLTARLVDCKQGDICASFPVWETALMMTILTQYGFFSTGHQATISNIPWYAAFIGWSGDHTTHIMPTIMLNVNIFSSHILISMCGLLIPLLVFLVSIGPAHPFRKQYSKKKDNTDEGSMTLGDFYLFKGDEEASKFSAYLRRYFTAYLVCQSTMTLSTMISSGYGRRHLMAWKIFVPKMMFSVLGLTIVYLSTGIGYLIVCRVHRLAVDWRRRNT